MWTASSLLFLFVTLNQSRASMKGERQGGKERRRKRKQTNLSSNSPVFSFAARSSQERKTTAHCLVCIGNKTESKYRYKIDSNTEEGWRFWPTFLSITTPV